LKISNDQIDKLLDGILQLHPKRIDLSLDRVQRLLGKLNNPQGNIKNIIHIGATNGKYSVLRFIQEILRYNKKTTNAYISPHLKRFNERFQLMDEDISNENLFLLLNKVKETNDNDPITFFEATSAAFFEAASKNSADYTLLEVGLGGRLDSSNVVIPTISVINSISYDHQDFLGDDIFKISFEKSGIIKKNIPVVIGYQPYEEARQILIDQAQYMEAPTLIYGYDFFIDEKKDTLVYEDQDNSIKFSNIDKTLGQFQIKNLATAIATCLQLYKVEVRDFLLSDMHHNICFPGRFEKLTKGNLYKLISNQNELYLDGSHNPDGSKNINESLKRLPKKKLCLIIGMINTKDPLKYISEYENIDNITTIAIPDENNSYSSKELKNILSPARDDIQTSESIEEAVRVTSERFPDSRILICGSLYLAGKILDMN
tara:strand:+ start:399 stop:1688 length:1290 start_codon:yes stop_codon:yes gene_type:complete